MKQATVAARRLRDNESEHEDLLHERDRLCRELREARIPIKDLQELFGLSRSRIQQILRG